MAVAIGLTLAVLTIAAVGLAVSLLASDIEGGVAEESSSAEVTRPALRGLDDGSLLTRPMLERALNAMRAAELGRPMSLRAAPYRVDARWSMRAAD